MYNALLYVCAYHFSRNVANGFKYARPHINIDSHNLVSVNLIHSVIFIAVLFSQICGVSWSPQFHYPLLVAEVSRKIL